jgi:predicted CxxxxCH...CXXCH cytochrome family protein
MPSLKRIRFLALFFVAAFLISAGCGSSKNDASVFDEDSHPTGWKLTHKTAAENDITVCMECHGEDLGGGISKVACSACHVNGNPLVKKDCTSCHGTPPDGTTVPNRAAAHNTTSGHFAPGVVLPDSCNTCHNGAGAGTSKHDNGTVDIVLLTAYSSNSGTAVHNADGTCSNISCHGGQTTPPWLTGSIILSTQCTLCHAYGTSEYNSFVSGQHDFHVNTLGKPCVACHYTVTLAENHFTTLNTRTMEGSAAATIGGGGTVVTNYVGGTCTNECHDPRSWF